MTKKSRALEVLETLTEVLGGDADDIYKTVRDTDIEYAGKKITLPNDPREMEIPEAVTVLQKRWHENEQLVEISETIDAFPWDGAHAMGLAMREMFGWAEAVKIPGGFFRPDQKPQSISVESGYGKTTEIMWGRFVIQQFSGEEYLQFGMTGLRNKHVFHLSGEIKRKHRGQVKELVEMARGFVKSHSLYRGKAFILPLKSDGQHIDYAEHPRFLNPEATLPEDLIYSRGVTNMIDTNLFTPIMYTDKCREAEIPLKRGILLEGPYGVGKTMLGSALANVCSENNWTFILLKRAGALDKALEFAELYAPAVVFSEDIDRVVEGKRTVSMDDILNTIDGVSSKRSEIITVLTTNHVEQINKAMMRPGRLDAIISLRAPDAEAVQRLIRSYGGPNISQGEDLEIVGAVLDGQKPAVIREVVERAKLQAIGLSAGTSSELTGEALKTSADTMMSHIALMEEDKDVLTKQDLLWDSMQELVSYALQENGGVTKERVEKLEQDLEYVHGWCQDH